MRTRPIAGISAIPPSQTSSTVGPAAHPYQVSAEVAGAATAAFGAEAAGLLDPVSPGQWRFALWAANNLVLREAGVVDAGGKGFTLLLAAFLEIATGRAIPDPEVVATPASVAALPLH